MTREEEFQFQNVEIATPEVREEDKDLGFGSKVVGESRLRFINRDGSFNVRRTGLSRFSTLNFYHILLTMNWTQFLGLVLLLYFLSNLSFGFFYALLDGALVDTSELPMKNVFLRGFFFSVQTFATIGYGTIHPLGIIPNLLVTIESYYSLLANALITGLVFARFSRPTAKIIFSDVAVVAPYRGITGFMFRVVNSRNNQLIEVNAQVTFSRFVEKNGELTRKFSQLKLEREKVTFFPLSWTIVHPIDEKSPMYNLTQEDLEKSDAEILILLSAMDETFAQPVHTRSSYKHFEINAGYKFANLYNENKLDEPISIDIRKLSKIEKV
ncbi:MAG TPA: ion channel [Pyrinomonadaceae bacterium]|jgi:inward rectifier potassium channel